MSDGVIMKIKQSVGSTCAVLAFAAMAGCATTGYAGGRGQMESTVYDIHRRVVKLDSNLESTIQQLTALVERVNQSDENARRVYSISEENQVKLDQLQRDVNDLKQQAYRHWGLSAGSNAPRPNSVNVTVEPPAATAPVPVSGAAMQGSEPLESPALTEQVAQPAPAAATPAASVSTQDPQVHYQRAQKNYAAGEFAKAKAEFEDHLRQWPGSETASNALFWKAKCNLKLNDYRGAISDFEQLRREYSSSTKVPFAMHNQAVAHANLGETQQAQRLLEEVIANYPASPAAEQAKLDLQKLKGQ
jgi:tol-pal system protein YbgF